MREGTGSVRGDDEHLDPVPVRVRGEAARVGAPRRGWRVGRCDDLAAAGLHDPRRSNGVAHAIPDRPVRPDAGAVDVAVETRQRRRRAGREVDPHELRAALVFVAAEERGGVGPPSHGEDPAGQIDVQVSAVAAAHVPDRGPLERPQFAREGESLVPRHRRPRDGVEVAALVLELADHLARARVEHPERRMQEVAVLGVLDAHEGAVGGEPAAEPRLQRPHPGRGLVVCEDPGGAVPLDQVVR